MTSPRFANGASADGLTVRSDERERHDSEERA
jgi:hypothetical protein